MAPLNPTPPIPEPPDASSTEVDDPGASRSFSLSQLVGVLFLASQVIFVVQTHFAANTPRLLTPVEGLTRYELHATSGQTALTATEIQDRYGLATHDDSALTAGALRAAVAHREKPIPLARALKVRLRTREANDTEDFNWLWPQE